jgi:ubiquinone/menaquinone biosynthesis C-methylase UbiE
MTEPGSHWVRWHEPYDDPDSALSLRLRLVQAAVSETLNRRPAGPIAMVSICAGQGRDVIDVVAAHPRRGDVRALLVERDPALVAFARRRAAEAGVRDQIEVREGDASIVGSYAGFLPADLVLICGVFGNVGVGDIRATVSRLRSFCTPGGTVVWTRHRRPPDLTPSVREWLVEAGFEEVSFVAPVGSVLGVGCHRLAGGVVSAANVGIGPELDLGLRLFDFMGDGSLPA